MWWFEKKIGLKIPDIPALHRGKLLKGFQHGLRENPALIMSNAPTNILDSVPLSDTGVPDREQRNG